MQLSLDPQSGIREISGNGFSFAPMNGHSLFELNGCIADLQPGPSAQSLELKHRDAACVLRADLEEEECLLRALDLSRDDIKTIGLALLLPEETEFHIPEKRSTGRLIDREMPCGESYSANSNYNFVLIKLAEGWLRFMVGVEDTSRLSFEIVRHPHTFSLTVSWPAEEALAMRFFGELEEAVVCFKDHLKTRFGVAPLRDDPQHPGWVENVPLVLTLDMMRSHGEICHNYSDLTSLADDLKKVGCPPESLFYLAGWNAAYDAGFPDYRPCAELGGEDGFKRMIERIHDNGYRTMLHANPKGIDPFCPNIERLLPFVIRGADGRMKSWQTGPGQMPPTRNLKFRPGLIDIVPLADRSGGTAEFQKVPDDCDALLRIHGEGKELSGLRFSMNGRSQKIPAGEGVESGSFLLPLSFPMKTGSNKLVVEKDAGRVPEDLKIDIEECFQFRDPFSPWTYPILHADTENPEWIEIFVGRIAEVVEKYQIDAIHLDAATMKIPQNNKGIFNALKERLPGTAIGGEFCSCMVDFGYWSFCQGGTQDLVANAENIKRASDCNSIPPVKGLREHYAWLGKASPVGSFVKEYIRSYYHLCAADAFVPVGKVCNTLPARKMPFDSQELRDVLANAEDYGVLPNIRVNYREYGLDDESRAFIKTLK